MISPGGGVYATLKSIVITDPVRGALAIDRASKCCGPTS